MKYEYRSYPPGLTILELDACDSTNNYLKENQEKFIPGFPVLVTANRQTAGRGRENRTWLSPEGLGLYSSFGFYLGEKESLGFLSLAAGISVIETLEEYKALDFSLKWPNDILYGGKKICGVLIENKILRDRVYCIAGIGINLNQEQGDFPGELADRAVSLKIITGKTHPAEVVNKILAHRFLFWLGELSGGRGRHVIKLANRYSGDLLGKEIRFHSGDRVIEGIFKGIHKDGGAIIEHSRGARQIYYSGEIDISNT